MSIEVRSLPTPADVASHASEIITDLVENRPDAVLGLATGSTPIDTYRTLVERHREGLSFSRVTTFNLDEYVGLGPLDAQSYHTFMASHLFDHIDIPSGHIHIPDGNAEDLDAECDRYERAIIGAGGVDLWILGIGSNGHIAFNEPGCDRESRTRVVDLAPETIIANSRFFDTADEVPGRALTTGIATIMEAGNIVLLAHGRGKAEAVAQAVAGPVSSDCPASFLQNHPNCTFLVDAAAGSLLDPD